MLKMRVLAVFTRCSRTTSPAITSSANSAWPLISIVLPNRPMAVNVGPERPKGTIFPSSIRTSSSVIVSSRSAGGQ
jgi:hypothetical protein